MSRIAEPTTEQTIAHPAWCNVDRCSVDAVEGIHWSDDSTHEFTSPGGSRFDVLVALSRVVNPEGADDASVPYLRMDGESECSLEQLDGLARWLTERVSEYRQAIATEGGALFTLETTVLDDDLNLTVRTEDDLVVMTGDPADGLWYFGAKEARELAAALLAHAAPLAVIEGGAL